MSQESTDKKLPWPARWLFDEKFWRDIAVQVIAGSMVVFGTFVVAVVTGYLKAPTNSAHAPHWLVFVMGVLVALCDAAIVTMYVAAVRVSRRPENNWGRSYVVGLAIPMGLLLASTGIVWAFLAADVPFPAK